MYFSSHRQQKTELWQVKSICKKVENKLRQNVKKEKHRQEHLRRCSHHRRLEEKNQEEKERQKMTPEQIE